MAAPINLPDIEGWEEVSFDPVVPRSAERIEGRRTEMQRYGTPYWTGTWNTGHLSLIDFGRMDAFMMRAGDDGETFRGYDAFRPRPILMDTGSPLSGVKAGGGAFNGTATLQAILDSRRITVAGLPAAFKLAQGDYVELRMSATLVSLHRVAADATASATGVVTLQIRHWLDLQHFTLASVVNFEKPACLMQIDPGSYSAPKSNRTRRASFSAAEVFFSV